MGTIINIILFVLILGLIVAIHELGHLIFAKRAKILCFEYALGMGPVIYRKKNKETDFSVRAIPIGGFVSMAGEQLSTEMIKKGDVIGLNVESGYIKDIILHPQIKRQITITVEEFEIYDEKETGNLFIQGVNVNGEVISYPISEEAYYHISEKEQLKIAPYNRSFESKTFIQKFLTLIAGPGMNFLLALLLFFLMASIQGKPLNNNVVSKVELKTPAALAGIEQDDEIIAIGNYNVTDGTSLSEGIYSLSTFEDVEVKVRKKDGTEQVLILDLLVDIIQIGVANYDGDLTVQKSNEGAKVGLTTNVSRGSGKEPILLENDIITKIRIAGKDNIEISNWKDLIAAVQSMNLDGEDVIITVLRDGKTIELNKIQSYEKQVLESQNAPSYNVLLGVITESKYNFVYSLYQPFISFWDTIKQIGQTLKLVFGGSQQIGFGDLSGPVGIFKLVEQVRAQGFIRVLWFTAFLSINIGILNLLPIPVLDGGRILLISIEAVTRKRIPRKVENIILQIFFFLMMGLLLYVTFNDILKFFIRK